ncbi:hypothetical protein EV421DRAFT_1808550 [Armillaria borealis]|uniref:Uncharacterized protein n=1 Tax=Armillaria borealis TaxID=47425 RepID=A0AA39JGG0_9AGAR|nr:hypothetical protein EV421DRAFT_1808550 [Armillaria borealis]
MASTGWACAQCIPSRCQLQEEMGSVGVYSHSMCVPFIQKNVAKFIEECDGYPSSLDNIFSPSARISSLISMLISVTHSGILIKLNGLPGIFRCQTRLLRRRGKLGRSPTCCSCSTRSVSIR